MRTTCTLALVLALAAPSLVYTQARRTAPRPAAQAAVRTEAAKLMCPSELGPGVQTGRMFCDVITGRSVADQGAIVVELPPHRGDVTLTFDLHNRHTYSEELVKTNRGYRRYTATIGVLTADNTLLTRAVVQNEFRSAADLVDRVGGGAGPGGVKAVAPTGSESITVVIPAGEKTVSILGEKLSVIRPDSPTPDTFTAPGRPVAVISNVMVQYRPAPAAPARRPPARRAPARR